MKTCEPDELPVKNLDYQSLFRLVCEANAELANYPLCHQGAVYKLRICALDGAEVVCGVCVSS